MTSYRFQVKSRQCFAIFKWITRTYLQHREFYPIYCGNLFEKRIQKIMNMCLCITESLFCTHETNTIVNQLYSNKIKILKKERLSCIKTLVT